MIDRLIRDRILADFGKGKVVVLLGARQVGKTTLLKSLCKSYSKALSLNCDNYDDAILITDKTSTELESLLSPYDVVFIDEVQRVKNIGLTLKKIGDLRLKTQVIVTGSSSLGMADEINEPATGRLLEYGLYPFSSRELANATSERDERRMLATRMVFGYYPEVVVDSSDSKRILMTLVNSYLYKDLFTFKGIKKPDFVQKLVRALALQVGSEVTYNGLSNLLGVDKQTVENYIDLLEKCFIVFRLSSYSNNHHTELKKGKKVYFYDNGVRNAVLNNFAPLELRGDVGALWENFIVSERIKRNALVGSYAQLYFWRNHNQSEIDLVEEADGYLKAFEFKWNPKKKASMPAAFSSFYPDASYEVITPDNFWHFVG